jgi:hypothetical protein
VPERQQPEQAVTTVVGVPVMFETREEVTRAIALAGTASGGPAFLFAGMAMVEVGGAGDPLTLEIHDRNERLRAAFVAASPYSTLTQEELDQVGRHRLCLYLVNEEGGSVESARRVVRFARGLLDAGGLAVKVESAGKAHSRADWARIGDRLDVESLLDAFVVLAGRFGDDAYSCGMHNIGLPDVDIAQARDMRDAGRLLWTFCRYIATEAPTLRDGETFSPAKGSPMFRLRHSACHRFPQGDLFHNPFGVWHLIPA